MVESKGDHIVHAVLAGGNVRALAAVSTNTVEEARSRHHLYPTAAAALGRTLTATALMGAMLKAPQRTFVDVVGDGPLGNVRANADAEGNVRGYVGNPHVHLPLNDAGKLDVKGAVGDGSLYVMKDLGLREPYRGSVPLISGEIGEDFAYYFLNSEQTPSLVSLGVLVGTDNAVQAAGGIIVQLLPDVDEEIVTHLETVAQRLPAVSGAVRAGQRAKHLIEAVADGLDIRWLHEQPLQFFCGCSKQRFERALIALGADELEDMRKTDGRAEIVCHFCSEQYNFNEDDLRALHEEATKQVH